MNNYPKMTDLIDELLSLVKSRGCADSTIRGYSKKCKELMDFFDKHGCTHYNPSLMSEFSNHTENRFKNEEISRRYLVQWKRVIRLIDELALTKSADLSPKVSRTKYIVSQKNKEIIDTILDYYQLTGIPRYEVDVSLRHICFFLCDFNDCILDITDDQLLKFINIEMPASTSGSKSRTMRAVKLLSDYFHKQEINTHTLNFNYVHIKDRSEVLIKPFSPEEIKRILDAIDTNKPIGLRDYAIVLLGFDTGLRIVDIKTLQFPDIDWKNATVKVNQDKTNTPLVLPLTNRVMNAISEYILKGRPESDSTYIFLTTTIPYRPLHRTHGAFTWNLRRYCDAAGIKYIPGRAFHSLRRSFATELSLAGESIEVISQMLGHKSILEDKPYLSYNREQISFCSFDFSEIPITSGFYAPSFEEIRKESECHV